MSYNPYSLDGKTFLVTGASSGIGRATSIVLSRLGADLVLLDKDNIGLLETWNDCRITDKLICFDLREDLAGVLDDLGSLDGLVHCAGVPYIAPLKAINKEKYIEVLRINTLSALELAKVFIGMSNSGSIVFISSVHALVGSPANVGYAMSKAALHGITKSLAMELAPKKIRVNCIAPGFVKTNMSNDIRRFFDEGHDKKISDLHPLGAGEPEDVAYAVAYLLSDAAKWVTGIILNIDGGYTAQ